MWKKGGKRNRYKKNAYLYWAILKKVLFGIFRTILVFKEEKKFTIESKDKGYLWASFHDIWLLSKSSKLDIQKAISAKQIMIWKISLCKKNTTLLSYLYQTFIFLQGHLHFFWHFFFLFMENLFKKHPIYTIKSRGTKPAQRGAVVQKKWSLTPKNMTLSWWKTAPDLLSTEWD